MLALDVAERRLDDALEAGLGSRGLEGPDCS